MEMFKLKACINIKVYQVSSGGQWVPCLTLLNTIFSFHTNFSLLCR